MNKTPKSKIDCNMRYAKNNLKRIPLDVKKEYYTNVIEKEAYNRGMSVRAFILQAIEEKIERENNSRTEEKPLPDEISAIKETREDNSETVPHDSIDWD